MTSESAYDRVLRILAGSVGIGSVVFSLLAIGPMARQMPYLNPVFAVCSIVLFCGVPPVLGLLALRAPIPALRVLAGVQIVSAVVILLLWVPASLRMPLPDNEPPWVLTLITVATSAAAIVLRPLFGWIYLVAISIGAGILPYVVSRGEDGLKSLQDGVMTALFSAVMLALLQLTLRAGREQDAAAHVAREAAAAAATAQVLDTQRTNYQAFTHDNVLATLLSASRNTPDTIELTRASARSAILKLEEFRHEGTIGAELGAEVLGSLLAVATVDTDVVVDIAIEEPDGRSLRTPIDVAEALSAAVAEAVRNSLRHADWPDGRPVHRSATVRVRGTGAEIIVRDDGRGFNPRKVGVDRLGVRLSILQRVNTQPGGLATIESSRGRGTTVTLRWIAPRPPRDDR